MAAPSQRVVIPLSMWGLGLWVLTELETLQVLHLILSFSQYLSQPLQIIFFNFKMHFKILILSTK